MILCNVNITAFSPGCQPLHQWLTTAHGRDRAYAAGASTEGRGLQCE